MSNLLEKWPKEGNRLITEKLVKLILEYQNVFNFTYEEKANFTNLVCLKLFISPLPFSVSLEPCLRHFSHHWDNTQHLHLEERFILSHVIEVSVFAWPVAWWKGLGGGKLLVFWQTGSRVKGGARKEMHLHPSSHTPNPPLVRPHLLTSHFDHMRFWGNVKV